MRSRLLATTVMASCLVSAPAWAETTNAGSEAQVLDASNDGEVQADDQGRQLDIIIVQARKRQEDLQDVPVVAQAFDGETLDALGVSRPADLNDLVSGLTLVDGGAINPSVNLRGIRGDSINASTDESISFNLDGIQHSNSHFLRFGAFDIAQVEVLKGPQSLFFGKNSPGGIIAYRTRNPTDELFMEFQAGYEFNGEEVYGHAILSGPLSDNWGARVGLRAVSNDGIFTNEFGLGDPTAPQPLDRTSPDYDEYIILGTLRGEYDRGTVTLKGYHANRQGGLANAIQIIQLNDGTNAFTDATLNDTISAAPFSDTTGGAFTSDRDEHDFTLTQFALDIAYELSDFWSVNSVTGIVDVDNFFFGNIGARQPGSLAIGQRVEISNFSTELRVAGDYDNIRVLGGFFYDDRETFSGANVLLGNSLRINQDTTTTVEGESWSLFGQIEFDLTDRFTVSAGGRYLDETRRTFGENIGTGGPVPGGFVVGNFPLGPTVVVDPIRSFTNFSPEISLTYKPVDDVLLFANYKEAFKSGGFNSGQLERDQTTAPGAPPAEVGFSPELVEGFEFGVNSELFDRTLRLNIAAFFYDYTDLQISQIQLVDGFAQAVTTNAGQASVNGVEVDMLWATPVDGLTITGSLAYLDSTFGSFTAPCSNFQIFTDTTGCDVDVDGNIATDAGGLLAGTGFDAQDRSGDRLRAAGKWTGSLGYNFETDISDNLVISSTARLNIIGPRNVDADGSPLGDFGTTATINANIGIGDADDTWKLELIARNLTDQVVANNTFDISNTAPAGLQDSLAAERNLPRQIYLQFTFRPFGLFQ